MCFVVYPTAHKCSSVICKLERAADIHKVYGLHVFVVTNYLFSLFLHDDCVLDSASIVTLTDSSLGGIPVKLQGSDVRSLLSADSQGSITLGGKMM